MAVKNQLKKTDPRTKMYQNQQTAVYEVGGVKVELTPEIVKSYMVSGNPENVTIQEVVMFMQMCKSSGLNPWAKEAYCIKYGSQPATMVVGIDAYRKRAESNPAFDGYEAGIITFDPNDGEITRRVGSFKPASEEIIGGYATVWRKDRRAPYKVEVSFDEYAGRKKDGSLNSQWSGKPGTMIRKVALAQALKEAFPSSFGGMFIAEEQGYTEGQNGSFVTSDDEIIVNEVKEETVEEPQHVYAEPVQEDTGAFF